MDYGMDTWDGFNSFFVWQLMNTSRHLTWITVSKIFLLFFQLCLCFLSLCDHLLPCKIWRKVTLALADLCNGHSLPFSHISSVVTGSKKGNPFLVPTESITETIRTILIGCNINCKRWSAPVYDNNNGSSKIYSVHFCYSFFFVTVACNE